MRFGPLVPGRLVPWLSYDGHLILAARAVRTFAYGYLSVILGVYLEGLGLAPWQIGAVFVGGYNAAGALAGAAGSLFAAAPAVMERWLGLPPLASLRMMFVLYAALGLCVLLLFTHLSPAVELAEAARYVTRPGLRASR